MDDKEIIELFWARNEDAIAQSDIKYGKSLKTLSNNILQNHNDCEECVNDTYVKAWETIPPKKPYSLFAYLGKIVRNISIDLWRKNSAQKRNYNLTVMLSELSECIPETQTTEEKAEERVLSGVINSWLVSLSEDDRFLFTGRYWFGEDVKSLSKKLKLSPNATSARLFKLRKRLQSELEKEGISL